MERKIPPVTSLTRSQPGRVDEIRPPGADAYNDAIKKVGSPGCYTATILTCVSMIATVASLSQQVEPDRMKTGLQALHRFAVKMAAKHHVDLEDSPREPKRPKFGPSLTRESSEDREEDDSDEVQDESDPGREMSSDRVSDGRDSNEPTTQQLVQQRLETLVLSMTVEIDTDALAAMQNKFITRMQELQVTVIRDNKPLETTFSADEIAAIANFFFSDLVGPKALKRLRELVNFYTGPVDGSVDRGIAARARMLAQDTKTPDMLRPFFGAFSRAAEYDSDENRVFKHVQQVLRSLEFVKEYNQLKAKAQRKDAALIAVLKQQGQTTKKGVTLMSCLINVLSASLNTSRTSLSNTVQSISGIERLVECFGEGLIVLLPPGSGHRLSHWGNQKMAHVYPILQEELHGLHGLCDYLGVHLLDRIRRGEPIPCRQIKTGTKRSLQERIQEAVEEVEIERVDEIDLRGIFEESDEQ